jgi:hypothetical protein
MKLSQDLISFIETVVKTGQSVNIDNVIIEPDMVRAIDDARTVVLYQNTNVPEMPFGSIGLNRINIFLSRLEIAKSQDNFTLDVTVDDDAEYARAVTMKGTGTKIDYRCANPATIQAPRQINDNLIYRVQMNAEAVSLLQKGQVAMGSETVTIVSDDGVSFELTDVNSDVFKHTFAPDIELLDEDASPSFTHRYPAKTLLALFKQNPDGHFDIGEKGILNISVNGLSIYVLPQV